MRPNLGQASRIPLEFTLDAVAGSSQTGTVRNELAARVWKKWAIEFCKSGRRVGKQRLATVPGGSRFQFPGQAGTEPEKCARPANEGPLSIGACQAGENLPI